MVRARAGDGTEGAQGGRDEARYGEEEDRRDWEDMAEERTTDVAHYANVSRYVVQRKQTEPEAPTPYTRLCPRAATAAVIPLAPSPVA